MTNLSNPAPSLSCSTPNSRHPAILPVAQASHRPNSNPKKERTRTAVLPDRETVVQGSSESALHREHSRHPEHSAYSASSASEPPNPPDTGTVATHSTAPAYPAPPDSSTSSSFRLYPNSSTQSSSYPSAAPRACPPESASIEGRLPDSPASARTPGPRPAPSLQPPAIDASYLY